MLINLSNQPSEKWSEAQAHAAKPYGETVDVSVPSVDPKGNETYIANLADKYLFQFVAFRKYL